MLVYMTIMMILFAGLPDVVLSPFVRAGDAAQVEVMRLPHDCHHLPVQNGKTYYFDNSFTRASDDASPIVYGASAVYCLGNV